MPEERILGTGIDIVETDRMRNVLERWGDSFRNRVFVPDERSYCDSKASPSEHYAGRLAVKEAVSKAFGTGLGPSLTWSDIEVVRDAESGAPSVRLSARGQRLAETRGVTRVLVSLSHSRHYAVAHAILVGDDHEAG